MTIFTKFEANVLATIPHEFTDEKTGKPTQWFELAIMTPEGAGNIKCHKDINEFFQKGIVKPMEKCVCVATYQLDAKKEFRVVGFEGKQLPVSGK